MSMEGLTSLIGQGASTASFRDLLRNLDVAANLPVNFYSWLASMDWSPCLKEGSMNELTRRMTMEFKIPYLAYDQVVVRAMIPPVFAGLEGWSRQVEEGLNAVQRFLPRRSIGYTISRQLTFELLLEGTKEVLHCLWSLLDGTLSLSTVLNRLHKCKRAQDRDMLYGPFLLRLQGILALQLGSTAAAMILFKQYCIENGPIKGSPINLKDYLSSIPPQHLLDELVSCELAWPYCARVFSAFGQFYEKEGNVDVALVYYDRVTGMEGSNESFVCLMRYLKLLVPNEHPSVVARIISTCLQNHSLVYIRLKLNAILGFFQYWDGNLTGCIQSWSTVAGSGRRSLEQYLTMTMAGRNRSCGRVFGGVNTRQILASVNNLPITQPTASLFELRSFLLSDYVILNEIYI